MVYSGFSCEFHFGRSFTDWQMGHPQIETGWNCILIGQFLLVGSWFSRLLNRRNSLSIHWCRNDIDQLFVGQKRRLRNLTQNSIVDFDGQNSSIHGFLFFPLEPTNQPMKWLDIREHPKNMVDIFKSGASQPQEAALMSEKARFIQPLGAEMTEVGPVVWPPKAIWMGFNMV